MLTVGKKKCKCTFCENTLPSTDQSDFCESCLVALDQKDVVVSVCWKCGSVTAITDVKESERPPLYRGIRFERYWFAKGCRNCLNGNQELEHSWMTIRKDDISNKVIDGRGDLWLTNGDNQLTNSKQKEEVDTRLPIGSKL